MRIKMISSCLSALFSAALITGCSGSQPVTQPPVLQQDLLFGTGVYRVSGKSGEIKTIAVDLENATSTLTKFDLILPDAATYTDNNVLYFDADPDALSGSLDSNGKVSVKVDVQCPAVGGEFSNTVGLRYTVNGVLKEHSLKVIGTCVDAPLTNIVSKNTRVVDNANEGTVVSFDPTTGQIKYRLTDLQHPIVEGDVLVSGVSDVAAQGFIQVVTNVQSSGDLLTVTTVPGGLPDVFDQVDIDVSLEGSAPTETVEPPSPEPKLAQRALKFPLKLSKSFREVIDDKDGNLKTTDDQTYVAGSLDIKPVTEFKYKAVVHQKTIKLFGKKIKIPIGVSVDLRAGVGLNEKINASFVGPLYTLIDKKYKHIIFDYRGSIIAFSVGPVPIVLVPHYEGSVSANFNASAQFSVKVDQGFNLFTGIKTGGTGIIPYFNTSNSFNVKVDKFDGQMNGDVTLNGRVTLSLYDALGPYFDVGLGPKISSTIVLPSSISWSADACINASVGLQDTIKLFEIKLFSFKFPLKLPKGTFATYSKCLNILKGQSSLNSPPSVTLKALGETTVVVNTPLTVVATASDPDGDPITLTWTPTPDTQSGPNATFSFSTPGTKTITVQAKDSKGAQSTATLTITVTSAPNRPPTVSLSALDTVAVNTPLTVVATASDPDGDPITLTWTPTPDSQSGPNATYSFSTPGTKTITVQATDSKGAQSTAALTITVTPMVNSNHPPTISDIRIVGIRDGIYNICDGNRMKVIATANDPDSDPLTYTWSPKPFEFASEYGFMATYDSLSLGSRDPATITVTVSDGRGGSITGSITVFIICNS